MRAYVTGATGFIGSRVARALLRDGWDVTVLARSAERAQALADAGARVHLGDITDPASIRGSIAGHDALFHLAAWYAIGVRDRARIEQINVGGTVNVLDAAAEAQIPKIVYCSTVAALGTARTEASAKKRTTTMGRLVRTTRRRSCARTASRPSARPPGRRSSR
ncbi:MAG: SDR family NAD(P)-dependent oxidoreductase [Actinomycetota bacterium]